MAHCFHQDLLALELRRTHKELPFYDRITVHRKGVPGHEEDEPLAHELRCFPNESQVLPHTYADSASHHLSSILAAVYGSPVTAMRCLKE